MKRCGRILLCVVSFFGGSGSCVDLENVDRYKYKAGENRGFCLQKLSPAVFFLLLFGWEMRKSSNLRLLQHTFGTHP